jgi:3-oxoacyl-[acyl-carrier protein] reductase
MSGDGKDFKEKVVLVTGGSRGIGRACALAFARRGASVVISYAGNEAAANETLKLVEQAGGKGKAVRFDVADTQACSGAVEAVVKEQGRLDVLVNNAGVAVDGLVMRLKDEDWDKQLDTNLKGAFALIRAASRPMMKQRAGAIINLTSVVGEMGNAGQAAYSASKAGLIGLTKSIARELASRNIRVNAVSPGFIDTDMTAGIPEEARKKLLDAIPLARLGAVDDIANAVVFLASDQALYITGEVLKVNGGMYM